MGSEWFEFECIFESGIMYKFKNIIKITLTIVISFLKTYCMQYYTKIKNEIGLEKENVYADL